VGVPGELGGQEGVSVVFFEDEACVKGVGELSGEGGLANADDARYSNKS